MIRHRDVSIRSLRVWYDRRHLGGPLTARPAPPRWLALPLSLGWLLAFALGPGLFLVGGVLHALVHDVAGAVLRIPRRRSLGIGPVVWEWPRLRISAVPGAWIDAELDDLPAWRAALYLAAGPLGSLLLAWALPWALFTIALWVGRDEPTSLVGAVDPGSEAATAGLREGDRVVAVDGQDVAWWADVDAALATRDAVRVTVDREGEREDVVLHGADGLRHEVRSAIVGVSDPASPAARAGLRTGDLVTSVDDRPVPTWGALVAALGTPGAHRVAGVRGDLGLGSFDTRLTGTEGLEPVETYVGSVVRGSPAQEAGLDVGDRVLRIDGADVTAWSDLVRELTASDGRPLTVDVLRDGHVLTITVQPAEDRVFVDGKAVHKWRLGVGQWAGAFAPGEEDTHHYGPTAGLTTAGALAADDVAKMAASWEAVFTGTISTAETLGGPGGAGARRHQNGWSAWLVVVALILANTNLALAVGNVLPLPYSDLTAAIDLVLRRTVGVRVPQRAFLVVTAVVAVAFGLFVFAFDVQRFLASR